MVIKAFDNETISGNIWDKMEKVLDYIKDNVTKDGFKLIDPGNQNNNVADTLETTEKETLKNKVQNMLNNIDSNSGNIKIYFPVNSDFQDKNKYKTDGGGSPYSVPSTTERFG
jgi:hypothetical protein